MHAVLLAVPIFMGIFTLCATVFMWRRGRRQQRNVRADNTAGGVSSKSQTPVEVDRSSSTKHASRTSDRKSSCLTVGDINDVIEEEKRAYAATMTKDQQDALASLQQKLDDFFVSVIRC